MITDTDLYHSSVFYRFVLDKQYRVLSGTRFPFPDKDSYLLVRRGDLLFDRLALLSKSELEQIRSGSLSGTVFFKTIQNWRNENIKWVLCLEPIEKSKDIMYSFVCFALEVPLSLMRQRRLYNQMQILKELAFPITNLMNNPMGSILNQIGRLLSEDWETINKDGVLSELKRMQDQIYTMSTITNALALLNRPRNASFKMVNINKIIDVSLNLTRFAEPKNNINYQVELCNDLPYIRADSVALEQCFVHLLRNAKEALPKGGQVEIKNGINPNNPDYMFISIHDSGSGISPRQLNRIFDPFFTTKDGDHPGLGLCVAYGIITDHNGYLEVEAGKQGTNVNIWLPNEPSN